MNVWQAIQIAVPYCMLIMALPRGEVGRLRPMRGLLSYELPMPTPVPYAVDEFHPSADYDG